MNAREQITTGGVNLTSLTSVFLAGRSVYTLTPDGTWTEHPLPFTPTRFTHAGTLTAVIGPDGAAVLSGAGLLGVVDTPGPHAFIDGRLRVNAGYEDVGGFDARTFGAGLPDPVVAGLYRGAVMALYTSPAYLSEWAGIRTERSYVPPPVSSQLYVHPQERLALAPVPGGLLFTVDDSQSWQFRPMGGMPVLRRDAGLNDLLIVDDRVVDL